MVSWAVDYTPENGRLNYEAFRSWGGDAVYLKASEGVTGRTPGFAREWASAGAARRAGFLRYRGAYAFVHGRHLPAGDIAAEVATLVDQVRQAGGFTPGDYLVPDLEGGGFGEGKRPPASGLDDIGDVVAYVRQWRDELARQAPGVPVLWYGGQDFCLRRVWLADDVRRLPWIVANYPTDQTRDSIPARFDSLRARLPGINLVGWQYGGDRAGAGFGITIDVNFLSDGALAVLDGGPAPTPPDPWRDLFVPVLAT